jgi:hypothetical protein
VTAVAAWPLSALHQPDPDVFSFSASSQCCVHSHDQVTMNEPSSEESEEFEFSSMSQVRQHLFVRYFQHFFILIFSLQVFEYMRLTNTHLDDQQLRIIAAGLNSNFCNLSIRVNS